MSRPTSTVLPTLPIGGHPIHSPQDHNVET
ncbi:uncharacterized protein METZ01_LOCUS130732 [marine metagenome]|uniref:Uncharacterized protein n=1 Tax=marine metagenome TaxID=408172 RepID=A0A381YLE1_9ZZZZ